MAKRRRYIKVRAQDVDLAGKPLTDWVAQPGGFATLNTDGKLADSQVNSYDSGSMSVLDADRWIRVLEIGNSVASGIINIVIGNANKWLSASLSFNISHDTPPVVVQLGCNQWGAAVWKFTKYRVLYNTGKNMMLDVYNATGGEGVRIKTSLASVTAKTTQKSTVNVAIPEGYLSLEKNFVHGAMVGNLYGNALTATTAYSTSSNADTIAIFNAAPVGTSFIKLNAATTLNLPPDITNANGCTLQVINYDGSSGSMIFFNYTKTKKNWIKYKTSGVWSDWFKLIEERDVFDINGKLLAGKYSRILLPEKNTVYSSFEDIDIFAGIAAGYFQNMTANYPDSNFSV